MAQSSTGSPSSQTLDNDPSTIFEFLLSILLIFVVFITFTVVWERLVVRHHAINTVLASGARPDSPRLRQPEMWDICVVPDKQPPPWLDMKPVAAQKSDRPPSSSRITQTEQTTSFRAPRLLNRMLLRITHLFRPSVPPVPSFSDTRVSQVELSHGSESDIDIQVLLLVVMPHALQSTRAGYHPLFHEVAFATTNVFYHDPTS